MRRRAGGCPAPARSDASCDLAASGQPRSALRRARIRAAQHIARTLASNVEGIESAECFLVSQIGGPISQPKEIAIRTKGQVPENISRDRVEELVHEELARLPRLWEEILVKGVSVY